MRILIDVFVVIEVDELVMDRLTEDQPNRQQQKTADGQHGIAARPMPRERRFQAIGAA